MQRLTLRVPLLFAFGLALSLALSAVAQSEPLPEVGEVGQGIEWRGVVEPTPLFVFDGVGFEARGLVGTETGRLIGFLGITANQQGYVASAWFPALGGDVTIALLDGGVPVAERVITKEGVMASRHGTAAVDPLAAPATRTTAPVTATGDVTIGAGAPPTLTGSVRASLFQYAGFASASGQVVPAPMFELDLGVRTQVNLGSQSFQATTVRFLANRSFPPPGSPSSFLERVDVFTGSALGGAPGPSVEFVSELVEPGVLFSGVPLQPDEGSFPIFLDPARETISGVVLGPATSPAVALTGDAAGLAVAWRSDDLAAGGEGSSAELAAIGQNINSVQVRGVVTAKRTGAGWDLSFRPPGGLAGVPRTVEVDGVPVGEVTVPAPQGVFALSPQPPSGASAFPIGLGEGAFYGFSWDGPVPITVPGVGSFTGRDVRLVFPDGIGPLAFAGLAVEGLDALTLTGLAAPAVDDGGPCIATATRLCLAGGRFAVEVAWSDPFGGAGAGVAHPLTTDTGAFWFFDEANLELMVKVLDACPVNGRFWVFAGGLTDVEVELLVTDTRTGTERAYPSSQGQAFQPIQDTAAFVCGS